MNNIFIDSRIHGQSAHFGWQNVDQALYGIREGYKNAADSLVEKAIRERDTKSLETLIFPVMFSYRHAIEIILKHIYFRAYGELPGGGHDLLALWNSVCAEIINKTKIIDEVMSEIGHEGPRLKKSLAGIDFDSIRDNIQEIEEAGVTDSEIRNSNRLIDQKATVWRYSIDKDCFRYFQKNHSIDYVRLRDSFNELYDILDYIYMQLDEQLSSDSIEDMHS